MKHYEVVLFDLGNTLIYFDRPWSEVLPHANLALMHSLERSGLRLQNINFLEQLDARLQEYYAQRETEFIEYTTLYILRTLLQEMGYSDVPDAVL